jgi:hypothetical protein
VSIHRLYGIRAQVHQDLVQLRRIADDEQRPRRQLSLQTHLRAEGAAYQLQRLGNDAPEIDRNAAAALAAAVCQDLVHEPAGAVGRSEHVARVALERRAFRGLLEEQLGIAQDAARGCC